MISESGNIIILNNKEILSKGVIDIRKYTEPFNHFVYHLTKKYSYVSMVERGDSRLLRMYFDIKYTNGRIYSGIRTLYHGETTTAFIEISNDGSVSGKLPGTHSNYEKDIVITMIKESLSAYLYYYYTLCLE